MTETIQIYTEWANYYLERKSKRKIINLSEDIRDGLILAELIEVVTSIKVIDLHKKPKNQKQMLDNINFCLNLLKQQEINGIDDITPEDICSGRLKSILSLFFALSRYKQANKQREISSTNTSIPVSSDFQHHKKYNQEKVRSLPLTPNQTSAGRQKKKPSNKDSNDSLNKLDTSNVRCEKTKNKKLYGQKNSLNSLQNPETTSTAQQTNISTTKHSGILRLFSKEKPTRIKSQTNNLRASSSSGFSSAKSDSSISLNDGLTSNKSKLLSEPETKGYTQTKSKFLSSKTPKFRNVQNITQSVDYYTNTNITIVDQKCFSEKLYTPNDFKTNKISNILYNKSQEVKGEQKIKGISNMMTSSSYMQSPVAKPVATVKGTSKTAFNMIQNPDNYQEQHQNLNLCENKNLRGKHLPMTNLRENSLMNSDSITTEKKTGEVDHVKSSILPMKQLLKGYNNRVTLPRSVKTSENVKSEYDEKTKLQGYNSDSDALTRARSTFYDTENGYFSEGGSTQLKLFLKNRQKLPTTIEEKFFSSVENILEHVQGSMDSPSNNNVIDKKKVCTTQNQVLQNQHEEIFAPRRDTKENQSPLEEISPTAYLKDLNRSKQITQSEKSAAVTAVPRSKKVSGGTQTATNDFSHKVLHHPQYRSFSLTGQGATQLSQSVKERFGLGTKSLPKSGLDIKSFSQRMHNRSIIKYDGSLSDTQTYAEVKPDYSVYSLWLNKSNTANHLSDGESIESTSYPSLQRNYKVLNQREPSLMHSPRLNRSNSIRSTKSEKLYPPIFNRGQDVEIEPYYCLPVGSIQNETNVTWSQPSSPTLQNRGATGILSPTNSGHRIFSKKNDEVHGSQVSLLSGGSSSIYGGCIDEKQFQEVRRLKRELCVAREQIMSLSSQLSTNAHVVSAFEQSLSNMTTKLHQLTATTEKKDSEILEMRQTIELLRKQSIQAGLTTVHMQSMGVKSRNPTNSVASTNVQYQKDSKKPVSKLPQSSHELTLQRQHSSDSMCSLNSISSGCSIQDKKKKKGWLRSSFSKAFSRNAKISKTDRHVFSQSSNLDLSDQPITLIEMPKQQMIENNVLLIDNAKPIDAVDLEGNPLVEDLKKQLREKDMVLTDIRLEALSSASQLENLKETVIKMREEMKTLKQNNERLQRLITSRSLEDSAVSLGISPTGDQRLSLSTENSCTGPVNASEIEQMLDCQLNEMLSILQPLPKNSEELPTTQLSPIKLSKISSTIDTELSSITTTGEVPDGKKIAIAVFLGQPECFSKYAEELTTGCSSLSFPNSVESQVMQDQNAANALVSDFIQNEFVIAFTYISGKTTWQNLDYVVRKTFKEYLAQIDPGYNLGLNTDSISSYYLGEAKRGPEISLPELLPCGYIVGHTNTLFICLQGVSSLSFDSLIPRGIVNRYVNLLSEHRRLILCGPSGTGKSYIAKKLAEFLTEKSETEIIATFNVDNKSNKELKQYLDHISEQATNNKYELPSVIILENLHQASELGEVFSSLLNAGPKLPYLIATMSQSTCNATNLQLHHNFRWILLANHMEPVKGLLARYLRRKLYLLQLSTYKKQPQLEAQMMWLPLVWQHINKILETHCSSDITLGPRIFLDVPLDSGESEKFFINLWNTKLVPYIIEAVREGIQLYGRRGTWTDPCTFIRETWPWPVQPTSVPKLKQITVEEIGLEGVTSNITENDPLLEMLMRLQEAANCNGNKDDSDCESNVTHDSSAGVE